ICVPCMSYKCTSDLCYVTSIICKMAHLNNNNNELAILLVTISLLILATLWYKFKLSNHSHKTPSLPPGPISLPIVGYLPFLRPAILHRQFTNMADTYGPIFKCQLGSKLYIVINNPELAKVVVRDQDEAFSDRDQTIAALAITYGGKDIVVSNNNDNWRKLRKIFVHEMLSNKNLEASVRKTIKNVFGKIGTTINIRDIAFTTEASVLTRMVWGNTLDKAVGISNLGAELDKVASNIDRLFGRRDMKKQHTKLDQLFTSIIEDRIESSSKESQDQGEGNKDFLEILLSHVDEKDTSLNMTQMKALLLDVMIAGTDTTATTVEWAMASIMHNNKVMRRVTEELAEVVGLENIVQESHLPKLKYLKAREACLVGGYTIPKGCTIFVNVWSIHRDPRYWDNPLEFNPERFLTHKLDNNGNDLKFFPFGSGRRICAGVPLAEKMLVFILASLLHSFDWRLPKGEEHDLSETFGIVLKKRKPLVVVPSQ
ncbi:hypothetical protein M8C21_033291, partial [Ambrosia artemisiifolia]